MARKRKGLGFTPEFYFWMVMIPCLLALLIFDIYLFVQYSRYSKGEVIVDTETESQVEKSNNQESVEANVQEDQLEGTSYIKQYIPGIVCWGDSLTAGRLSAASIESETNSYPYFLQNMINEQINGGSGEIIIPVANMGISGETSITICGRNGSIPFITTKQMVIPASNGEKVSLDIESEKGWYVAPLRNPKYNVEGELIGSTASVTIATDDGSISISGLMEIIQETCWSPEYSYTFTRDESGDEVVIPVGAKIYFNEVTNYTEYVPIIYMGTNGVFENDDELFEHIDSIIEHQDESVKDKYIVVGLHYGGTIGKNNKQMWELDAKMKERYGEHYFSVLDCMCNENNYGAVGITLTDEDKERTSLEVPEVPCCIVADRDYDVVHFKKEGYKMIANGIFEKLNQLGYLNPYDSTESTVKEMNIE